MVEPSIDDMLHLSETTNTTYINKNCGDGISGTATPMKNMANICSPYENELKFLKYLKNQKI